MHLIRENSDLNWKITSVPAKFIFVRFSRPERELVILIKDRLIDLQVQVHEGTDNITA